MPGNVYFLELGTFNRHLINDIFRGENRLQIHPNRLYLLPKIQIVLSLHNSFFPFLDFWKHENSKW
jgi:hypothetical protein